MKCFPHRRVIGVARLDAEIVGCQVDLTSLTRPRACDAAEALRVIRRREVLDVLALRVDCIFLPADAPL